MRKRNTPGDAGFRSSHFLAHYNNIMPENRLKYAVGGESDGLSGDWVSKSDAGSAVSHEFSFHKFHPPKACHGLNIKLS